MVYIARTAKRWRDARMAPRLTGTAMLEAEKSFRREGPQTTPDSEGRVAAP